MDEAEPLPPPLPPPVRVSLIQFEPTPCPYLPGLTADSRGGLAGRIDPGVFEGFLNAGFRRSGRVLYQPTCATCRKCISLRMDVAGFSPTAGQRRIARRNSDLSLRADRPSLTAEKFDLYARYLESQHVVRHEPVTLDSLAEFLYESPLETTLEVEYRDPAGTLLGVGICDVTPDVLSSVYFFWDPAFAKRSPGIFSALSELSIARNLGLRWYHLGYWVDKCPTMHYKATFGTHQLLTATGEWVSRQRQNPLD